MVGGGGDGDMWQVPASTLNESTKAKACNRNKSPQTVSMSLTIYTEDTGQEKVA
jgi:hypothetical protein